MLDEHHEQLAFGRDVELREFCQVLKGSVTVTDTNGKSETWRTGDSFFMAKGFKGVWHMTETFRKYFVIYGGD